MESKTLYILCVLVAVLAAGVGYYALRGETGYTDTPQIPGGGYLGAAGDQDPYDALVTFTNDGYTPRSAMVAEGQRVRFVNASNKNTWPASAIHPTHSLYPGKDGTDCLGSAFDACTGVKPGEFWAFTFHHPGEWRYHDHLDATQNGIILVTPR